MKVSKIASTALILSTLTFSAPMKARAMDGGEIAATVVGSVMGVLVVLTTTAWINANTYNCDIQKVQQVLDQAYAGNGEKLEALAIASGKSLEETAEIIISLDKDGRLSMEKPEALLKTLAEALAK